MAYNNLNNNTNRNRVSKSQNNLRNRDNLNNKNSTTNNKIYLDRDNKPYRKETLTKGNSSKETKTKDKVEKSNKKNLEDYDEKMQQEILQEMKKIEKRRRFFVTTFLIVGFICIGYAVFYYLTASKSEKRWNDIAALVNSNSLKKEEKTTVTATLSNKETKELTVLPKYETLYNINKKLIGWLKIDDTIIDYPVMQCDNNTYYLDHNFDQQEDKVGTLFLDYQCDVVNGSDNYIIYGHHLQSGKMFSSLENYQSEKFYQKHKIITFDTIYEEQKFEVMYVFRSRVYNDDEVVFKYYQFINANSVEEFNSYMNEMGQMSFYDTGVRANYGDQLLTLSTCDYNENNGRFVVVAKKIN